MNKQIFINLPVADLPRSLAVWKQWKLIHMRAIPA